MRLKLLSLLCALSLVALACGGDDDGETTAADPGSDTEGSEPSGELKTGQGVSDDTIKIGVTLDQSGPFALFAPSAKAALDAKFSFINDNGGVQGRKIEAIYLDDKSDPALILQNHKRFWEQDKVLAVYTNNLLGPPLDYVEQNEVTSILLGGNPASFSSKYPTIIVMGSILAAWNAQSSYAAVEQAKVENDGETPKIVAVTYDPATESELLGWIEDYWKELGAEEVILDPGGGPTDPCDALVLKYKDAGVEYWDQHTANFLSCIPAELAAGWYPPMGQGGPQTSSHEIGKLIGKPLADLKVIAGSPNSLADGRPTDLEPTPMHLEYMENIEKYQSEWLKDNDMNAFEPMILYTAGTFLVDAINGAAEKYNEISPESIVRWAHETKDWDPFLAEPVKSMAPDCKTGNDSTIWGWWQWNEEEERLFMEPFAPKPGEPMVNNDWMGFDECYLTELADQYFAK